MTDLDYKEKKNNNSIPENASHANDDDLYAASLIDRVKDVKHTKGTLYFVGITILKIAKEFISNFIRIKHAHNYRLVID